MGGRKLEINLFCYARICLKLRTGTVGYGIKWLINPDFQGISMIPQEVQCLCIH